MKFAKYWSEAFVAADEIFGANKLSTWGASNESQAEAGINASERAARLKQLISRGVDALREYEYWNGYIREEVIEEILDRDGRILGVLTRNMALRFSILNRCSSVILMLQSLDFFQNYCSCSANPKKTKRFLLLKSSNTKNKILSIHSKFMKLLQD